MRKILILALLFCGNKLFAQCTTTISTFPYTQSFEANNGGWVDGGTASDWFWGTPAKPIINSASNGSKCWVSGGLTGASYNSGERSYVVSPCFNFTNVQYPHVSFDIFWETEFDYDGANFQYSLNNGATWNNVGAFNDPVDCLNMNWFNTQDINYIVTLATPRHGWSGSLASPAGCASSNGSSGWVNAKHCMPYLAGVPNVQFRFTFGAGTQCNNFDGFAFDNIVIGEAPANNADFTFNCTGFPDEYQFNDFSTLCPTVYTWDFGDPASGFANTSSLQNPVHQFSSPGTYTVTLTVNGPCNAPSTITHTVTTLTNSISATAASCASASNGSITSTVSNATNGANYVLTPGNISNATGNFLNVTGGTYTVTVTDGIGCVITSSVQVGAPLPILVNTTHQNVSCNGATNGSIQANANGGSGVGYNYLLNPGNLNNTTGTFNNLGANAYTVTVTDNNGCVGTTLVNVTQNNSLVVTNFTVVDISCSGQNTGSVTYNVTGGAGSIIYALNGGIPNTFGFFGNLSNGIYTVEAMDANGCTLSNTFTISTLNPINLQNIQTFNPTCNSGNDGTISISATGGNGNLSYSIGNGFSASSTFNNLTANTYTVVVKDGNGCSVSSVVNLTQGSIPLFTQKNSYPTQCYNSNDGRIEVAAVNGTSIIATYELIPGNLVQATGMFNNLSSGNYTIIATDGNGCSNTATLFVGSPQPLAITNIINENEGCTGSQLNDLIIQTSGGTGALRYYLNPGGFFNVTGKFYDIPKGTYAITVLDANDCNTNSTFELKEKICCDNVFVPSAFSPNNDNKNDELRILNKDGILLEKFIIVNRFGNIVFTAQHEDDRWDGKYKSVDAEIGTYYYLLQYKCLSNHKSILKKGDILLVR